MPTPQLLAGQPARADIAAEFLEYQLDRRNLRTTLCFEDFASDALTSHYALDPVKTKRTMFPDFVYAAVAIANFHWHGHHPRMTRAYRLDAASDAIAGIFGAHHGPDPWGGGALAPGEFAPVIVRTQKTGQRLIRPMVWGYPAPGGVSMNGEVNWVPTVRNLESPFWIGNLRHSELRCLVPATSFMLRARGKSHSFAKNDAPVLAMAGIWRDLTDMPVFAVIVSGSTGAPRDAGAFAMPVILEPKEQERWLTADWKDAQLLVTPFAGALTEAS